MLYRSRLPGQESPLSPSHISVKRWSEARPSAPNHPRPGMWFGRLVVSFLLTLLRHPCSERARAGARVKRRAREDDRAHFFLFDRLSNREFALCVCKPAERRCWPNCHRGGRNGPSRRQTFIQCAFWNQCSYPKYGRVHLKKTFCMSRVPAMFHNFSQILYRTQSFTLDVAHLNQSKI